MTALFESFSLTITLDVFLLSIPTLLPFSRVGKPILDTLHHGQLSIVSSQGHPSQSRRYRALHPGQLSARSSRGLVLAPDQLSAVSSQGHPSQSRRYRALHPGQLSARSSRGHTLAPDQHSVRLS